jgi:hypothetical protein
MTPMVLHAGAGRTRVGLSIGHIGEDLVITLSGGAGHIGAVAVADYRDGDGRVSVSVLTRLGHKEDAVATSVARKLCKVVKRPVCAIVGIHLDDITDGEITQILENCEKLVEDAVGRLTANGD